MDATFFHRENLACCSGVATEVYHGLLEEDFLATGVGMLTVTAWREFWFRLMARTLETMGLLAGLSLLFALPELGEPRATPGPFLQPFLDYCSLEWPWCLGALLPAFWLLLGLSTALQVACLGLGLGWTRAAVVVFVSCVFARLIVVHPESAPLWLADWTGSPDANSLKGIPDLLRRSVEVLPWVVIFAVVAVNAAVHVGFFLRQSTRFNAFKRGLAVEDYERESRRLAMGSVSLALSLTGGLFLVHRTLPLHSLDLDPESSDQFRPHVVMFIVDGVSSEKLLSTSQAEVMPFLRSRILEADFFRPLVPGALEPLPVFAEIASCQYGLRNGVRVSYPDRGTRLRTHRSVFRAAREAGYVALVAGGSEGEFLHRVDFGLEAPEVPSLDLANLARTDAVRSFAVLHAVLTLPRMGTLFDGLARDPGVFDPNVVMASAVSQLNSRLPPGHPSLLTVFLPKIRTHWHEHDLKTIDDAIKGLWTQLDEQGWLHHSVVGLVGLPPLPAEGGANARGGTDPVSVLAFWTRGRAETSLPPGLESGFVRAVDVAPTLARRLGLAMDLSGCDGVPLLDINDKAPAFPRDVAYQESNSTATLEKALQTLEIDESDGLEFQFPAKTLSALLHGKERSWVADRFRLAAVTTPEGVVFRLCNREVDPFCQTDLLAEPTSRWEHRSTSQELIRQMTNFLRESGVDVLRTSEGRLFFSELVGR